MIGQTSEGETTAVFVGMTRWAHCAVLGAACVLVIGSYVWCAHSGIFELLGSKPSDSYYNLLVQGFRAGQLNLKTEVPSGLVKLADPYDPSANAPYRLLVGHPLFDTSYYQGKLYLYFGVTPALVLFWPYAVLTGHYLLHKDAAVIFCAVGFLASVRLLCALWRRYFAEVGVWVMVAGTLALGLASGLPVMLHRCDVHEVAISCGYALVTLTLVAIWRALHDPLRRGRWLVAGSLAYGLALGARPSLLFGAVILLVPVVQACSAGAERSPPRPVWVLALAAISPIVLIGLGLMLYNALRFDNPLEFGQRYQLAIARQDTQQHFSQHYLWFNIRVYFLEPARWSSYFPLVQENPVPPLPAGHFGGVEHTFGVLTNTGVVWLSLAVPLAWRNRVVNAHSLLLWFSGAVALLFGMCALTLGLFNFAIVRYEVEFLPELVLLAVIGILGLERALSDQPAWRRAARWGWNLLLAFSVMFNLLASYGCQGGFHYALGFAFLQKGQLNDAVIQFRKTLEMQPNDDMAHADLGAALLKRGQVDEAMVHLQRALEIKPSFVDAHNNLGLVLLEKGRVDEGIAQFQKALDIQPNDAEADNNLGVAFLRKGQIDEAIAAFQQALKINPDFAEPHVNLGYAFLQKGEVDEAIAALQKGSETKPDSADLHINLGIALLQKGRVDEAIGHFQKTLELQPAHASAHNSLGNALLTKGRVDEAIAHFRKAVQIQPDFATAHFNLSNALHQKGQVDEAIAHYQKALELQADFPEAHYNLGITLHQTGRLDEAISQYREALRLRPDYAEASNSLAVALGMKQAPAKQPATPARP